jgi:hypothetical protein
MCVLIRKAIENDALWKMEGLSSVKHVMESHVLAEIRRGRHTSVLNTSKMVGVEVASLLNCNKDVVCFAAVSKHLAACAASQVQKVLRRARDALASYTSCSTNLIPVRVVVKCPSQKGTGVDSSALAEIRLFQNIDPTRNKLGIWSEPWQPSACSRDEPLSQFIEVGEVFAVSDVRDTEDGNQCLRLAGKDGWVFTRGSVGQVVRELPLERLRQHLSSVEVERLVLQHEPSMMIGSRIEQFLARHHLSAEDFHMEVFDAVGGHIATLSPPDVDDTAPDVDDYVQQWMRHISDAYDPDRPAPLSCLASPQVDDFGLKNKLNAHALKVGQAVRVTSDPHLCVSQTMKQNEMVSGLKVRNVDLDGFGLGPLGKCGHILDIDASIDLVLVDVETIGPVWIPKHGVHAMEDAIASIFPLELHFIPKQSLTRAIIAAAFWQVKVIYHHRLSPSPTTSSVSRRNTKDTSWFGRNVRRHIRRALGRRVRFSAALPDVVTPVASAEEAWVERLAAEEDVAPLLVHPDPPAIIASSEAAHVVEEIVHMDVAAVIDPDEAQAIAHEQWATSRVVATVEQEPFSSRDIVVLALTRHSKDVEEVLLNTDLSKSLVADGVEVKPAWAGGAKIFLRDFGPGAASDFRAVFGQCVGLGPNHVVVESKHEAVILKALKPSRRSRSMATVKPGGRLQMLAEHQDDCFAVSPTPSVSDSCELESSHPSDETLTIVSESNVFLKVTVKNTFVHLELDSNTEKPLRRCKSDPWLLVDFETQRINV